MNTRGERFMPGYHEMKELAPRDIVSRAIVAEMKKTGSEHVFLDMSGQGEAFTEARFPTITATLMEYGIHPGRDRIPVAPAAHYMCGGVKTDIDGRSSIQGLYAGGEVACTGVHGANRLASNSLLESVVFAYRAAVNADRRIRYLPDTWWNGLEQFTRSAVSEHVEESSGNGTMDALISELQTVNWSCCGIIRSNEGLRKGLQCIHTIERKFREAGGPHSKDVKALALGNLLALSKLIYHAASRRTSNAGAHYNIDNCDADTPNVDLSHQGD